MSLYMSHGSFFVGRSIPPEYIERRKVPVLCLHLRFFLQLFLTLRLSLQALLFLESKWPQQAERRVLGVSNVLLGPSPMKSALMDGE